MTEKVREESEIILKDGYILDYLIGKPVNITKPEEKARQEYEKILHTEYHYPKDCCDIKVSIKMGNAAKSGYCNIQY